MNLHDRTRIYVAPKREALPRRRYRMGLDRPQYNWWHLAGALTAAVVITVGVWAVWP